MIRKIFYILSAYIVVSLSSGCTKLEEQILDETSSTGATDKDVTEGLIAPVYAVLPGLFQHTQYFALQQISTDQAILPYRGGTDWGDNGIYMSMFRHQATSVDPNIRNVWNNLTLGISRAILAITTLPTTTDPNAALFQAEARGMRAYYNLLCLDLFGLSFLKEDPLENSVILRGNDAVEYIKSELLAIEPLLRDDTGPGRFSKQAAWGLLARLHLQSAVYRDVYGSFSFTGEDMDKVIEYCDRLINSGKYALSPEYFKIFDDDNNSNRELIFAVDQRADLNGHNRMGYFSLSGDQFPLAAYPGANGTDGPGITSDFYQTWVAAYGADDPADMDPRFYKKNHESAEGCIAGPAFHIDRGILRGQQYGLIRTGGVFETCPGGEMRIGPLFSVTRNRPDLAVNFTERIDFTIEGSNYNNGFRVSKYEFSRGSVSGRNFGEHDLVILRLADVYLMRAEARLRKGAGGEAAALDDVNTIRAARTARVTAPQLTEMNLDLLYRERGFELYWENVRRTDMIRFGKYEGTWTEKTDSNPQKRLFPIPQNAIDGASNLPGYLVQNPSY